MKKLGHYAKLLTGIQNELPSAIISTEVLVFDLYALNLQRKNNETCKKLAKYIELFLQAFSRFEMGICQKIVVRISRQMTKLILNRKKNSLPEIGIDKFKLQYKDDGNWRSDPAKNDDCFFLRCFSA